MFLGADFSTQEWEDSLALRKGWEEGEEGLLRGKMVMIGELGPLRVTSWTRSFSRTGWITGLLFFSAGMRLSIYTLSDHIKTKVRSKPLHLTLVGPKSNRRGCQ